MRSSVLLVTFKIHEAGIKKRRSDWCDVKYCKSDQIRNTDKTIHQTRKFNTWCGAAWWHHGRCFSLCGQREPLPFSPAAPAKIKATDKTEELTVGVQQILPRSLQRLQKAHKNVLCSWCAISAAQDYLHRDESHFKRDSRVVDADEILQEAFGVAEGTNI